MERKRKLSYLYIIVVLYFFYVYGIIDHFKTKKVYSIANHTTYNLRLIYMTRFDYLVNIFKLQPLYLNNSYSSTFI